MKWLSRKGILITIGVLVGLLVIAVMLTDFFVDIMWFNAEGYESVFWTRFWAGVEFGLIVFAGYGIIVALNLLLAHFFSRSGQQVVSEEAVTLPDLGGKLRKHDLLFAFFVGGLFAIFNGVTSGGSWQVYQKFIHATAFGSADPIFAKDISFYIFKLPFYRLIYDQLFGAVFIATLLVVGIYVLRRMIWVEGLRRSSTGDDGLLNSGPRRVKRKRSPWHLRSSRLVKGHIFALVGVMFGLKAWGYYLEKFDLLHSVRGGVFGASYTDVNIDLPMYQVLFWLTLAFGAAFFLLTWLKSNNFKAILLILAVFIVLPWILLGVVPWVVEDFIVEPNQYEYEKPYIEHNIAYTGQAYGLDEVQLLAFGEQGGLQRTTEEELVELAGLEGGGEDVGGDETISVLNRTDIDNNEATIRNIRLWDWAPLNDFYTQKQTFRDYYEFLEMDIDRYDIDGFQTSMVVSLRELNSNKLPEQAQTWQNRHLSYTHGYGAVANPVNLVSPSGKPVPYVQDIPLNIDELDLDIAQPRIYFGEGEMDYAFCPSGAEEIDYYDADRNVNVNYNYEGGGGIPVGGFWRRLLMSIFVGDIDVLLSDYITAESELLIRRNVSERVRQVAPYLVQDSDAYPVLTDDGIYWIVDCYTTTALYPYSEPMLSESFNYIRNSVKVVVNAYSGKMDFYITEVDPLIETWAKVFPGMYKPLTEMPPELHDHIRYPNELFAVQSVVFSRYHMRDPWVFYQKSDSWVIPGNESGGIFNAYYMTMKLPRHENEEFLLIIPFVPKGENRNNMVGWMCARCDEPNYGELILYTFPATRLVYGPKQIKSLIAQDPAYSQAQSLWSEGSSNVQEGRMVILPIEDSVLYVQPIYLRASDEPIPEIALIVLAHGDNIAMYPRSVQGGDVDMSDSLRRALNSLFPPEQETAEAEEAETAEVEEAAEALEEVGLAPTTESELPAGVLELTSELADAWNAAMEARRTGDWAAEGRNMARVEELINELEASLE